MATFEDAYNNYAKGGQGQAVSAMYDANRDANLANMEAEYNRARSQKEADAAQIAGNYRQQFNDLGAQYERQRRNNNMQAAANGLNTGTASQMQLAQQNNYLRSSGQLGAAQAQEQANAARGLSDLEAAYRSQVNQAVANADYQKAQALLQGYNEDRDRQMQQAQMLAGYGIFSGFEGLGYSPETVSSMRELWIAQNPDLAYNTGAIDAERYRSMTGQYPAGYQAPSSGGGYYGGGKKKSSVKPISKETAAGTAGNILGNALGFVTSRTANAVNNQLQAQASSSPSNNEWRTAHNMIK